MPGSIKILRDVEKDELQGFVPRMSDWSYICYGLFICRICTDHDTSLVAPVINKIIIPQIYEEHGVENTENW